MNMNSENWSPVTFLTNQESKLLGYFEFCKSFTFYAFCIHFFHDQILNHLNEFFHESLELQMKIFKKYLYQLFTIME
jgi:hypothetical protein